MKREDIQKRMKDILDKADAEKRDLNDQEAIEFNGLEVALKQSELIEGKTQRSIPLGKTRMGEGMTDTGVKVFGRVGAKYSEIYHPNGVPAESRSIEEHMLSVTEKRTMNVGDGAAGGFFVPESFTNYLMDATWAYTVVYNRCMQFPMLREGNSLNIGAFDSSDQSAGFFGSVNAQWKGEGDAFDIVTTKVRGMLMKLHKLGIFTDLTREMIEDAQSISAVITQGLAMTLSQTLDEVILTGDGVAKPKGVLNAPCTITIGRTVASQVSYSDIIRMYSRLHPFCIRRACWIVSNEVLPQLLQLSDPGNNYIWQPGGAGTVANSVPGGLLGLPLFVSDKVGELGERGDVILGDFGFYGFVQKQGIVIETTNSARWTEDIVSYRAIVRADGMPMLHKPITPRNGGDSLSAFVVLE